MTERRPVEGEAGLLAHALRSISECVSITDAEDRVLFVNDAFLRTYGYDQDELLGKSIVVVRSPKNSPELVAQILPATLAGGWSGELWNRRKDGGDFSISLSTSVVRDGHGRPLALIGVARDITEEERADETLEQERHFALQVMGAMGQGLTVTDEEGRFEYVNPAYAKMIGRPPEEMVGKRPADFTVPEDHHALVEARALRLKGLTSTYETRLTRADGEVVPVVITGVPRWRDGSVVGTIAVITDLSERKGTERALQRRDTILEAVAFAAAELLKAASWHDCVGDVLQHLGRAAEVSRVYIFEIHKAEDGRLLASQRFEWVAAGIVAQIDNPELQNLPLGTSGFGRWVEVLGRGDIISGPVDTFPKSERTILEAQEIRSLAVVPIFVARQPWGFLGFDDCAVRRTWPIPELEALRAAAGTVGAAIQHERTEEALRASEERQALVLRSMPVAVYTATLGTETDASWISDNLPALTGYTTKSFVEVPHFWSERIHPEDRERTVEAFRRSAETGYVSVEYRWRVADGSYRCFLDTAVTRRVGSGGHEMVGTFLDVTDRKRMEEQLRHAQKMEAVGRLAGGIAHDFNNLLQAMLSLTQATLLVPDPTALPHRLEELADHIRRGAQLTRQLLLFSRREKPTPERFDLNELLRDNARFLRRLLRENIALQFDLSAQPLPIEADRGQIEQVVMNLAINASDAMQSGGALTVRSGSEGAAAVFFCVEDTGHGIPDELLTHLFEPFFTTKEAAHGTGLGLSVVHGIVTEHGGTVEVESRPGFGATFRVVLPRKASGEHVVVRERDIAADLPAGRGERVLLVEDEDAARAGLAEILTALGYEVEAVNSGEAAEALPAEPAFDLLLTDLMLPGKPGGEVAPGLCQRWPGLRVIYMSGYTEDEAVRRGAAEGSVRFLQKPFDMVTLAREVRAALDEV